MLDNHSGRWSDIKPTFFQRLVFVKDRVVDPAKYRSPRGSVWSSLIKHEFNSVKWS